MPPLPRTQLEALLPLPDPHEIAAQADALRTERFGRRATYAAVAHLDLGSDAASCPVCGADPGPNGFDTEASALPDAATDLHVLTQTSAGAILAAAKARPAHLDPQTTIQVGGASQLAAARTEEPALLGRLVEAGVLVGSDGVRPDPHPAMGEASREAWEDFWRAAARAGLRGHAVVLYGPDHDLPGVLRQIDAIAALQRDTGVFLSVTPVIHRAAGYGGMGDGLLTHGSLDLRVLAACRLGLSNVAHVRVLYNRSDLKLAHLSLACGADDLEGHLAFESRDLSADANAKDLSLREMPIWLREVGFSAQLRNALMQAVSIPVVKTRATEGN